MAHGVLQSFDQNSGLSSAGTEASGKLNPQAVAVMKEAGVISATILRPVTMYLDQDWDYVITVCGGANEHCPRFRAR
jgi:arsenate reductase